MDEMMNPGMGPAAGGGDDVMAMQEQEAASRKETIGAAAPQPTKPYSNTVVKGLVSQFNDTFDALGGTDMPDLEWAPSPGAKLEGPLPPSVYAPLVALSEALKVIAGGKFASKYEMDLAGMTDDNGVRKVTGILGKMEKDKELAKAMQEPMPGQNPTPQPSGPAPVPSEFTEDDATLMGGM